MPSSKKKAQIETIDEKICATHPDYPKPFFLDYTSPSAKKKILELHRKDPLRKTLGKFSAGDILWDFTFGFGFDSFHFAALGLQVFAWERSPEIFRLVEDGRVRALGEVLSDDKSSSDKHSRDKLSAALSNVILFAGNAMDLFPNLPPDLPLPRFLYLDPMFPEPPSLEKQQKRKKEIFFLRAFAGDDFDCDQLLALSCKIPSVERIIIKRPEKAAPIWSTSEQRAKASALGEALVTEAASKNRGNIFSIHGKSHRFDIWQTR